MTVFEPVIKTDVSAVPKVIETNLDELESVIAEKVQFAESLIVDSDNITECERADVDAAALNKMAKRISDFRISWTRQWQSPFEGVISKCKDYERRLKDAASLLRDKSEVGKAKVAERKKAALKAEWDGRVEEVKKLLVLDDVGHFDRFFETMCDTSTKGCWLNKGKSEKAIAAEMDAEISRCTEAFNSVLENYKEDDNEVNAFALKKMEDKFSITDTIAAVREFKEQRAWLAKAREADAQAKAKAQPETKKEVEPEKKVAAADTLQFETYVLEITGTREALKGLRRWGEEHGITFKRHIS